MAAIGGSSGASLSAPRAARESSALDLIAGFSEVGQFLAAAAYGSARHPEDEQNAISAISSAATSVAMASHTMYDPAPVGDFSSPSMFAAVMQG